MQTLKTYLDHFAPANSIMAEKKWLIDGEYLMIVKNTIIACADAVVTIIGEVGIIYLAKRVVNPQPDLWFIGGRAQMSSDNMVHAIMQNVERETKLKFLPERFTYLCTNDYKFARSAQGDFPVRSLASLFNLAVTPTELQIMSANLTATEYETGFGLKAFNREQLVNSNVHPAILDAFDLIWS